jgi:AraC-like DNA-binding protein
MATSRTRKEIIEEAAGLLLLKSRLPRMEDLAEEAGISRTYLTTLASNLNKRTAGAPTTGQPANIDHTEAA